MKPSLPMRAFEHDDQFMGGGTTEKTGKKAKGPKGRTDRSGQEKVIELQKLEDKIETLVDLYKLQAETAADLNEGIKAAAEESGLLATVVRKFIVARAGKLFTEKAREAQQLSLVFEEIGE